MYIIEEFYDNQWKPPSAMPAKENLFASEEEANLTIEEMRQHPLWAMAQFRIVEAKLRLANQIGWPK